jgi:hypothetical protein
MDTGIIGGGIPGGIGGRGGPAPGGGAGRRCGIGCGIGCASWPPTRMLMRASLPCLRDPRSARAGEVPPAA